MQRNRHKYLDQNLCKGEKGEWEQDFERVEKIEYYTEWTVSNPRNLKRVPNFKNYVFKEILCLCVSLAGGLSIPDNS